MKKIAICLVAILTFFTLGMTGCGKKKDSKVIRVSEEVRAVLCKLNN